MKLSIFGPRGCGKTTYITCLYGQGGKVGSFAISARDEATRNYLAERWHQLVNGTEIAPTALGSVPLNLIFSANRQSYDIQIEDFSGALVMRDASANELKAKLKEALFKSFHESSGVMLFIEAEEANFKDQFERRLEIEALLEVLSAQDRRELITRPIAIVVTKWDKMVASIKNAKPEEDVLEFVKKQYGNLYALLQECADNVKIFASSAYGFHLKGENDQLDFSKLQPFNLEKPFTWIGSTIDELRYKSCELFEKENPRNLAASIREYKKFSKQVNRGEYYEKAQKHIANLQQRLWAKRVKKYGIATVVSFLLGAILLFLYERNQANNMVLMLDPKNSRSSATTVIIETDKYLKSFHVFSNMFEWKTKVKNSLLKFQQHTEQENFTAIESLYKSKSVSKDENSINTRIEEYLKFLKAYPNSGNRDTIKTWIQEERSSLVKLQEEKLYNNVIAAIPNDREKLDFWIKEGRKFLTDFPNSKHQAEVSKKVIVWQKQIQELTKNEAYRSFLLQLIKKEDAIEYYNFCKTHLIRNPNVSFRREIEAKMEEKDEEVFENAVRKEKRSADFLEKVKGYKEYLAARVFKSNRKKVLSRLDELEKELYENMVEMNSSDNINEENAKKIAEYAEEYLKSGYHRKQAKYIRKWLAWFEEIKAGKTFQVKIKSASLSKKSSIFSWVTSPNTQVVLGYGPEKFKTIEVKDDWSPSYNKTASIDWNLGEEENLTLALTCFDYGNETLRWSSPDTFLLKYFNQSISLDSGRIKVHLKCRNSSWPNLPPYK